MTLVSIISDLGNMPRRLPRRSRRLNPNLPEPPEHSDDDAPEVQPNRSNRNSLRNSDVSRQPAPEVETIDLTAEVVRRRLPVYLVRETSVRIDCAKRPRPRPASSDSTSAGENATQSKKPKCQDQDSSSDDESKLKISCPICTSSVISKTPVATVCGHIFCKSCLENALKVAKWCPMCKKSLAGPTPFHRIFLGL